MARWNFSRILGLNFLMVCLDILRLDSLTRLSSFLSRLQARSLVNSLLVYDHTQRATVHSALKSKWIDNELDELAKLYQTRIEAENARNTRV